MQVKTLDDPIEDELNAEFYGTTIKYLFCGWCLGPPAAAEQLYRA